LIIEKLNGFDELKLMMKLLPGAFLLLLSTGSISTKFRPDKETSGENVSFFVKDGT
jgi:hypothetical protein